MDLGKAKYVIIALLIAFNGFLLFNNIIYFNATGVQKETITNTVSILKTRGIILACSIPSKSIKVKRLQYGNGTLEKAAIAGKLLGLSDQITDRGNIYEYANKKLVFNSGTSFIFTDGSPASSVKINNITESKKFARKYLENMGLIDGKYVVDETENNSGSVVIKFVEKYEGYFVFDNTCTVTLSDKGVTRLEYSKLQIIRFSPEIIGTGAAAYQALLVNYQTGEGQVISAIDMGYRYPEGQTLEGIETSELLPVWRVKMKGTGEVDYLSTAIVEKGGSDTK